MSLSQSASPKTKVPFEQAYEVYHYAESLCSQMVRIACEEKEIAWGSRPIMLQEVSKDGNNLSEHYLSVNPRGTVPTLVHEGTPVYDSFEIIKYLDAQNADSGERLYPDDAALRSGIEAWVNETALFDDGEFGKSLGMAIPMLSAPLIKHCLKQQSLWQIWSGFRAHPISSRRKGFRLLRLFPIPDKVIARAARTTARALVHIEKTLAESDDWLLGPFTQADVMLMAHFHRLEDVALGGLLTGDTLPHTAAYWQRLQQRPSYQAAVLDFHDEAWRQAISAVFGDRDSPVSLLIQSEIARHKPS